MVFSFHLFDFTKDYFCKSFLPIKTLMKPLGNVCLSFTRCHFTYEKFEMIIMFTSKKKSSSKRNIKGQEFSSALQRPPSFLLFYDTNSEKEYIKIQTEITKLQRLMDLSKFQHMFPDKTNRYTYATYRKPIYGNVFCIWKCGLDLTLNNTENGFGELSKYYKCSKYMLISR